MKPSLYWSSARRTSFTLLSVGAAAAVFIAPAAAIEAPQLSRQWAHPQMAAQLVAATLSQSVCCGLPDALDDALAVGLNATAQGMARLSEIFTMQAARSTEEEPKENVAGPARRFFFDIRAGLGAASNPYLIPNGDGSSFFNFEAGPSYYFSDERSETRVGASYSRTEYFDNYSHSYDWGADVSHRRNFSERLSFTGAAAFRHGIIGERTVFFDPLVPQQPGAPPPVPGEIFNPDVTLLGLREKRTMFSAQAGVSAVVSPLATLGISVHGERYDYNRDNLGDFWGYGATTSYMRTISERTSAGVSFGARRIEFDGGEAFTVLKPQLRYTRQLSPAWQIDAGVGALAILPNDQAGGGDSTDLSLDIRACRAATLTNFCLAASRDATGSGLGGVYKVDSAVADYSRRLSEKDTIRAAAALSRYRNAETDIGDEDVLALDTMYERELSNRLYGQAQLGYRDISRAAAGDANDVRGQIGIAYRIGN